MVVDVSPLPQPDITGTLAICEGEETTLDAGDGYDQYLWSDGSGGQTLLVSSSGTYIVTVTTALGCSGSDAVEVVESQNPQPTITGETDLCAGETTTLATDSGFDTYLWSTGAGTESILVDVTGTYTVTVTNAAGCSGTTDWSVTVHPNPEPSITGELEFCAGENTTLDAGSGFTSYVLVYRRHDKSNQFDYRWSGNGDRN